MPSALWRSRAKLGFANAIMGILADFPCPPALWRSREGQGGVGVVPSADEVGGQSSASPTRSWESWAAAPHASRYDCSPSAVSNDRRSKGLARKVACLPSRAAVASGSGA